MQRQYVLTIVDMTVIGHPNLICGNKHDKDQYGHKNTSSYVGCLVSLYQATLIYMTNITNQPAVSSKARLSKLKITHLSSDFDLEIAQTKHDILGKSHILRIESSHKITPQQN